MNCGEGSNAPTGGDPWSVYGCHMTGRRGVANGEGRTRFGQALGAALRSRDMTQKDLADALGGMAQSAISNWVAGEAVPGHDVVFRAERVLQLPPGYLSRHLGYVPAEHAAPPSSVEDAVDEDPLLGEVQRQALLALYREFTNGQSGRG